MNFFFFKFVSCLQEISMFSCSCTSDKPYLRGHRTPCLISSSQLGKNGFAAGPASCLSTHKGILDNSGIPDSTRHPCVGKWVELLISSLSAVNMHQNSWGTPWIWSVQEAKWTSLLFSMPKIKAVQKSPDIATITIATRKFWDQKK